MALVFSASIDSNIQRITKEINDRCYKITIELFLRIVALTPSPTQRKAQHATGLLVNQWYPAIGNVWSIESSDLHEDSGASSQSRIRGMRGGGEFFAKDGRASLSNSIPYAVRAEKVGWPKNEGWSGKVGPYAMVSLALQEIGAKYK